MVAFTLFWLGKGDMFLKNLRIENIRSLADIELNFSGTSRNRKWILIAPNFPRPAGAFSIISDYYTQFAMNMGTLKLLPLYWRDALRNIPLPEWCGFLFTKSGALIRILWRERSASKYHDYILSGRDSYDRGAE